MALRVQEIHPSLVHFPIALIPTAILADAIGRATGSRALMNMGRSLMPVAAASGMITGAAGLLAQGAVRAEGHAHDQLATHRTLNIGLVALTTAMAFSRAKRETPSTAYLLAGFAGMAGLAYSAYLGGKMVYEHGVGVAPAGGVRDGAAPEIGRHTVREAARASVADLARGAGMTADDMAVGDFVPALTR